jgi:hypothetical protein
MSGSVVPDSEPVEVIRPTTNVIPFPVRSKPAEPEPKDRLARALESLNAAMAEQKAEPWVHCRQAQAGWVKASSAINPASARWPGTSRRYTTGP